MDPVNKPYPNLPIPIDKKRIKITEPLEGSMSAFIIIKTDNAKLLGINEKGQLRCLQNEIVNYYNINEVKIIND